MELEDLQPKRAVEGVHPDGPETVLSVQLYGSDASALTYKTRSSATASDLLFRDDEDCLRILSDGRPWSFDGDGASFGPASESRGIRIASLFVPHRAGGAGRA